MSEKNIFLFHEVGIGDIDKVGGKGANLGEMTRLGIPVPSGFVVASHAYFLFLDESKLRTQIMDVLDQMDINNNESIENASRVIKSLIMSANVPEEIAEDIKEAYRQLSNGRSALVAARSSATSEDLLEASFAGQQASFLNVQGEDSVVEHVKMCWASLFEARAIFYRQQKQYDHFKVGIAVPIQKMIESEVSGVMFSIDPVTNNKNKIIIEAILGLGEYIVLGTVTPDHYEIKKDTLSIEKKQIVHQTHKLIRSSNGVSGANSDIEVEPHKGSQQKLSDELILQLARLSVKLENHYKKSQDIEWAVENNIVYIVQTRPITTETSTVHMQSIKATEEDKSIITSVPLLSGSPASPGISCGPVIKLNSSSEIDLVKDGDILVTEMTTPDFAPAMRRAAGIITDYGGRTCHAAIISRELKIPCIVGTGNSTKALNVGQIVTIDGTNGKVYSGGTPHKIKKDESYEKYSKLPTKTKVYVNLGEMELADEVSKMAVDGIGLLRAEFMIAEMGVHPKKMIADKKESIFIDKLYQGLSTFSNCFNPRPVIYRATDLKSDEYRNLEGGDQFEHIETNPILGYRGSYRYIKEPSVFNLELKAIRRVYEEDHFMNLHLEIPFVRNIDEMKAVRNLVDQSGLTAFDGFELWMMVEIPANVILLPQFIEAGKIQGVSIGSNDLSMLILGTDRDNPDVASEFDERDDAIMWALERTIKIAKEHGVKTSICGQAPSVYPEITKKLVEWGIDSISVTPDMVYKTRQLIYETEN